MPRLAAFLRGINVGGHRVAKEELRKCFEGIGLTDVVTFRASGNVVFEADDPSPERVGARIEEALREALSFEVRTFVRTSAQVRAIAERRPFPAEAVEASTGKLQVLLLPREPPNSARAEVLALGSDADRLVFGDRELYWLPSGRMADSALDLNAIERAIGPTTMRTKGTVEAIAGKYFARG